MPTEEERTFNEAMNEWAAKQSFFHNTRNRLVHPDPSLPLPFRIIGYLFRLAVVALIINALVGFALKKYVGGSGFGEMMAEKIAALVKADTFEGRAFDWKGDRAITKQFTATGSEAAFYKELTAYNISFVLPKSRLFKKAWQLDELRIAELDVLLRAGRKSEVGDASRGGAQPGRLAAGFGIDPDLDKLEFDALDIGEATFRWGVSDTTKGSLADAPVVVKQGAAGGAWTFDFSGGALTQNWWRELAIKQLNVATPPGQLVFSGGSLALPSGGDATLSGDIALGAVPQVNLQLGLANASVADLIPATFRRNIGGKVNAAIAITGSPNTQAGFAANVKMAIVDDVRLANIPGLDGLSLLLEASRVRQLPLSSGTIEFATGGGVLRVTAVDIACEGVGHLRGSFSVREAAATATPEGALTDLQPTREKLPDDLRWIFDGTLTLTVSNKDFPQATSPEAIGLFEPDGAGSSKIDIALSGPITEITRALQDRILLAIRDRE